MAYSRATFFRNVEGLVDNLSVSLIGSLELGRKQKVLFSFSRWFYGGWEEGSWDVGSLLRKLGASSNGASWLSGQI